MSRNTLIAFSFLCLFLSGSVLHFLQSRQNSSPVNHPGQNSACPPCAAILPQASEFELLLGPITIYQGFQIDPQTKIKKLCGYVYRPADVITDIQGYSGPIDLVIGISPEGTIQNIACLSHSETSSYVAALGRFLQQFVAKSPGSALEIGKDIDGITGATITSSAISRIVRESQLVVLGSLQGAKATPQKNEYSPLAINDLFMAALILGFSLFGIFRRNRLFRWTAMILALIYFGFIKTTFFSVVQAANIGLLNFPSLAKNPLWYFFALTALILPLVFGRIYCSSICPFASVQEILYNSFQKFFPWLKLAAPAGSDHNFRIAKYLALILAVSLSLGLGNADPAGIEVYITFFTGHGTLFAWGLVATILLLSLVNFRFWCKYLCPSGALIGLLSLKSCFQVRANQNCTLCQRCQKICPTNAITAKPTQVAIDVTECIVCAKCLSGCPEKALNFTLKLKSK